ncbi:MAG: adenylate/guanylate cyclase domain-containing protein [Chloroflexota bacterium]
MGNDSGSILIVDDSMDLRDLLSLRVKSLGHNTWQAENGRQALELLAKQSFDLVLLDIMMPEMNGYQVLERMREHPDWRHIPVVVISAASDMDSIVRCIQLGAQDYLPKPFNLVLLRARIDSSLERKRLRDKEQALLWAIEKERERAESLLLNILPEPIAERLKAQEKVIADSFEAVTVLFADIVDFVRLSAQVSPQELVKILNEIFSYFDEMSLQHRLEKIKTMGDGFMLVGGLPIACNDHAEAAAEMALAMSKSAGKFSLGGEPVQLRIGIHSGPVIAGVIGTNKLSYDLWGDTVNIASRMEQQGLPGQIQVSAATYELLKDKYALKRRGELPLRGIGSIATYILEGKL